MADLYALAGPCLRLIDAETAHAVALKALKWGLVPKARRVDEAALRVGLWGLDFPSPVGLAAGFDKNAEVWGPMLAQGFGFVEVGSVTPRAQPGNPKPRLFRLAAERAVINRLGFNNQGADAMAKNLARNRARPRAGIIGVNLGKNKDSTDAAADYEQGIAKLAPLADYLVVNVSSPNTPGLRALQGKAPLDALLARAQAALARACPEKAPPLLLKIAPDLTEEDKRDIAEVAIARGLDGLIATNTTIARPEGLRGRHKSQAGGLSGKPLFLPSTDILSDMYRLTQGRVALIGVGGVSDAQSAYAKIRAGASLVQLYTALVYEGPALVERINRGLARLLKRDGFGSVTEAVGADHG